MGARGFFSFSNSWWCLDSEARSAKREREKKYTLGMSYFFVIIKSTD